MLQMNELSSLQQAIGTLTALDQLHIDAEDLEWTPMLALCICLANLVRLQLANSSRVESCLE